MRWILAALLVFVLCATIWLLSLEDPTVPAPSPAPDSAEALQTQGDSTSEAVTPELGPSEPSAARGGSEWIDGIVLLDGEPTAASVVAMLEYEAGASPPQEHRLSVAKYLVSPIPELPAIASVQTGRNGRFRIENLVAGSYLLRAKTIQTSF